MAAVYLPFSYPAIRHPGGVRDARLSNERGLVKAHALPLRVTQGFLALADCDLVRPTYVRPTPFVKNALTHRDVCLAVSLADREVPVPACP